MSTEPNVQSSVPAIQPLSVVIPEGEMAVAEVPYFAATAKGWMTNIPTLFGVAHILSKDAPAVLPEVKELFHFNKNKLPVHIITQAHDFFRRIYNAKNTESSAFITYNDETGDYRLFIPEQYCTHGSVNHKLEVGAIRHGYRAVGTIHSHCNFGAFHSGTDTHDMEGMPGVHITLGHVDQNEPEVAIALSVNKSRFDPVDFDTIVNKEGILDKNGFSTAPEWWDSFHHTGNAPWTGGTSWTVRTGSHKGKAYGKPKGGYQYGKNRAGFRPPNGNPASWGWDAWDPDNYAASTPQYTPGKWRKEQEEAKARNADAFAEHAGEVEMSQAIMNYEVDRLAMYGFAINYSITYNPNAAKAHLADRPGAEQMQLEDLSHENRKSD